jgi:hypothetical protein
LIHILSWTTLFWEQILNFGKKTFLIGFSKPSTTVTILLIALLIIILIKVVFKILSKAIIIAMVALSILVAIQYKNDGSKIVSKKYKNLIISKMPNKTIQIVDNGLFDKKKFPEKFVNFELKPYLIKNYGTLTIDKIFLQKPSKRSFEIIKELRNTFVIKKVLIAKQ